MEVLDAIDAAAGVDRRKASLHTAGSIAQALPALLRIAADIGLRRQGSRERSRVKQAELVGHQEQRIPGGRIVALWQQCGRSSMNSGATGVAGRTMAACLSARAWRLPSTRNRLRAAHETSPVHGSINATLQFRKSSVFRVASLAPTRLAMAAICASNWEMGRPISRLSPTISA